MDLARCNTLSPRPPGVDHGEQNALSPIAEGVVVSMEDNANIAVQVRTFGVNPINAGAGPVMPSANLKRQSCCFTYACVKPFFDGGKVLVQVKCNPLFNRTLSCPIDKSACKIALP